LDETSMPCPACGAETGAAERVAAAEAEARRQQDLVAELRRRLDTAEHYLACAETR